VCLGLCKQWPKSINTELPIVDREVGPKETLAPLNNLLGFSPNLPSQMEACGRIAAINFHFCSSVRWLTVSLFYRTNLFHLSDVPLRTAQTENDLAAPAVHNTWAFESVLGFHKTFPTKPRNDFSSRGTLWYSRCSRGDISDCGSWDCKLSHTLRIFPKE
jgi:hypothetical protein